MITEKYSNQIRRKTWYDRRESHYVFQPTHHNTNGVIKDNLKLRETSLICVETLHLVNFFLIFSLQHLVTTIIPINSLNHGC